MTWKINWKSFSGRFNLVRKSGSPEVRKSESPKVGKTMYEAIKMKGPKNIYFLRTFLLIVSSKSSSGLSDFRTPSQQIKPNILTEIHPVEINAAGIGGGLLQGGKHIVLQRSNRQHTPACCFYSLSIK